MQESVKRENSRQQDSVKKKNFWPARGSGEKKVGNKRYRMERLSKEKKHVNFSGDDKKI